MDGLGFKAWGWGLELSVSRFGCRASGFGVFRVLACPYLGGC